MSASPRGGARVVVYAQNLGANSAPIADGTKVRLSWDPEHTFAVKTDQETEQAHEEATA